mmetsp:Transcript_20105/g.49262  ORF Transcript_20105/g.49262 Transcript_20105/m.49262 type:complete len:285 (+) Transcript_20105:330-1184(+)|eukprot:CAMPEP_0114510984 /NCGR_PEP_ID=MMETSP0109-20121206/14104_1 /TAXON_ID=29199 /ORGANISM="Chlorarachnion reptans, Strain CCCM449" /LENGTH=284 /DNA_ID=CAMNT_0001690379 /DNA_START=64 /DNA_END=918 /DNA_ORIENTATION=-
MDDFEVDESEIALLQKLRAEKGLPPLGVGDEKEGGEDEQGGAGNRKRRKKATVDVIALENRLEAIQLPAHYHWVETLALTDSTPLELENVHDDLKREAEFYARSLKAANIALANLKQMNIPFERPEDFYAEMVKSDAHMKKVKAKLLNEKKRMDAVATRTKEKKAKKFAKQVHANREQEKHKRKREELQKIEQMKGSSKDKMRINWMDNEDGTAASQPKTNKRNKKVNSKRAMADKKFGFGGKKKKFKRNDAESAADMSDFNPRVNSNSKGGKKKKKFGGKRRK